MANSAINRQLQKLQKLEAKTGVKRMTIITTINWNQFEYACKQIAKRAPKTITDIYGIPRGGLIVAIRLSYLLNKPMVFRLEDVTITTLVCDDISDTGSTLFPLKDFCKIATLVYHKQSKVIPDIWVYEKGDKYVNFPWERK